MRHQTNYRKTNRTSEDVKLHRKSHRSDGHGRDPYGEGWDAKMFGKPKSANPYRNPASYNHQQWNKGHDAYNDDYETWGDYGEKVLDV